MSALLRYELHCDHDDCIARYDSGDVQAGETRRHARNAGWTCAVVVKRTSGGPAHVNDYCPLHKPEGA